ncbi:MAG: hypothetical protein RBT34_02560 [Anaerolineaceae bacterium]|jgi:hypothetical protein|nr:hypothetical protein [Anaerolineaceae bacterium]
MIEKMKGRKILLVLILVLCVISIFLGVKSFLWARKQESINITPKEVIEVFQESGFEIVNIQTLRQEEVPLEFQEGVICSDLIVDGMEYGVCVGATNHWKAARAIAKELNALDDRMGGGFAYFFYHGSVLLGLDRVELKKLKGCTKIWRTNYI